MSHRFHSGWKEYLCRLTFSGSMYLCPNIWLPSNLPVSLRHFIIMGGVQLPTTFFLAELVQSFISDCWKCDAEPLMSIPNPYLAGRGSGALLNKARSGLENANTYPELLILPKDMNASLNADRKMAHSSKLIQIKNCN